MTSALEDIKSIDLEEWLTLATAPAPTKLKQGQTPNMQNIWTDEKPGSIITAPGFLKVGAIPSGNPVTFCINYFNTSAGTQTFVVSDNSTVWTTVDFQNFTPIITGLSSSFQLRGAVIRDELWLTNGSDAVRVFNGIIVTVLDGSISVPILTMQSINFVLNAGYSPISTSIQFIAGGTVGSEVVTVNGSDITVEIEIGVSTGNTVLAAIVASQAASVIVSASINAIGGTIPLVAQAPAFFTPGTPAAPRGRYIAYHDERVWLYHVSSNRSAVYFSSLTDNAGNIIDPTDIAAWDIIDNFLQVSEGDADYGTGMILYRGYLHFFKQYSIWRLVGYDEYTYSRVKTRASTGTRFNESLVELDSLIHLIGVDGLYVFDGEESVRISDIIDPATAAQTAFGFNQLQQPNTNNQFWEVTATADWNAGTVPLDIAINNQIQLQAFDDSQADFQAGVTLTNIDTTYTPGSIQLSQTGSGQASTNVALGKTATINVIQGSLIGISQYVTDGDLVNQFGANAGSAAVNFSVSIPQNILSNLTTIIIRRLICSGSVNVIVGGGTVIGTAGGGGSVITGRAVFSTVSSPTDVTITISPINTAQITLTIFSNNSGTIAATEIELYQALYNSSGQFTSRTLDLGITPNSLGTFNATEVLNGQTTLYFTQSSFDGINWDAAASVANGGPITSIPKRYLRWGVIITSNQLNTPIISAAYLPAVYISAIHNTGGNIFSWGPFESDRSLAGQVINYYYRTSTTLIGISSSTWNIIVPGGVISDPVANQFVQFKIEISGGLATNLPSVQSVTINWAVGSGGQPQTLQNVASTYWRNRYWLSAAGPGATSNNTLLIRGKKTFNSPWMLKDWNILSFTRYFDSLYGGSSIDGSIYQLDTGYSKAGLPLDSYFETHDFTFGGFTANLIELLVEAERTGPWNLNIGVSIDGGNTFDTYLMDLTPSTFDVEYIKRIHVDYTTTRFRFRFSTNGVDTPFQVHRVIAFYKLGGERGSIRGDYM